MVTQHSECLQVSPSWETYSPGHTGALCKQCQHTLAIVPRFRLGPRGKYLRPVTRTVSVTQFNKYNMAGLQNRLWQLHSNTTDCGSYTATRQTVAATQQHDRLWQLHSNTTDCGSYTPTRQTVAATQQHNKLWQLHSNTTDCSSYTATQQTVAATQQHNRL